MRYRLEMWRCGQTIPFPFAKWESDDLADLRGIAARGVDSDHYLQLWDTEEGKQLPLKESEPTAPVNPNLAQVGLWHAANNGVGKRIWFVCRELPTGSEYQEDRRGRIRKFGSCRAADRIATVLNRKAAAHA